jgi:DNA-binding MarR family transcriptional regulator
MRETETAPDATAMARALKGARSALIEAVRRGVSEREVSGRGTASAGGDGFALRAAHAQVFECLDPDGSRLGTLAERAQMTHQAMGEMVAELVAHGYLERVPDPVDRRARLIRPTARGRAELARAADQLRLLRDRWQAELDGRGLTVGQVVGALETFIRICEDGAHTT